MNELQVLVVDDGRDLNALIDAAAKAVGCTIHFVRTRDEFDALAENFDAFILNLTSTDYDGLQHLGHLSAQNCRTPIILVGDANKQFLRAAEKLALAQGLTIIGNLAHPFLPVELGKLLQRLRRISTTRPNVINDPISLEELRQGLEANELIAYFQPKVSPRSFRLIGVEALARWHHPRRGIVPPDLFVRLAEEGGLVNALFAAVTAHAFAQFAQWQEHDLQLKMALNVSTLNLTDSDLPQTILSLAEQHHIEPSHIVLELTESGLMQDPTRSLDVLARLCFKGIELSIDDFGTGYSTLQQLQRIPFSELKLDRSFVQDAVRHDEALVILESMYEMGRKLGMRVVAEGVETEEHWDLISKLGCDQVQGYLIGRPMPGSDLASWLPIWQTQSEVLQDRLKYTLEELAESEVTQPVTAIPSSTLHRWFLEKLPADQPESHRIPISEFPFRIGRQAGLPLRLQSAKISRLHAEITYHANRLSIRDFGSTNGTLVNHQRISSETLLKVGDIISFAGLEYRLDYLEEEVEPITVK